MLENYNITIEKYQWLEEGSVPVVYNYYNFHNKALIEDNNWTSATGAGLNFAYRGEDDIIFKSITSSNATFLANYVTITKSGNTYTADFNIAKSPRLSNFKNAIDQSNLIDHTDITCSVSGYDSSISSILYNGQVLFAGTKQNFIEDIKDINFFSNVNPVFVDSIDLKEYLIDIGNLEYTFDNADNENGTPTMFYEDSDISFTTSVIKNNSYLYNFFGINQDTSYYGYMVKIYQGNTLIWRGVVNQDSIEESFSPDEGSDQMKIQALGFLKEFKNYYSNKAITNQSDINWQYDVILNTQINHRIRLEDLLKNYLFKNTYVNIVLEDSIKDFYVRKDPSLLRNTASQNYNYTLFKTGYSRIVDSGSVNCWQFLEKLSNSMGWVFFFFNDKFYIQNRSTETTTLNSLDYNKFIEYTALKTKPQQGFDSIMLVDGEFFGGDSSGMGSERRGNYIIMFTKRGDDLKSSVPFGYVGTGTNDWRLYFEAGHRWMQFFNEDDANFNYKIYKWNAGGTYGATKYTIPQDQLLRLDTGDTGEQGWVYWTENTSGNHNYPKTGKDGLGDYDVWFKGNFGNILYKTVNNKYYNYIDHIKTTTFTNNFMKYYNTNASNKINVIYDELLLNPLVKFNIANNSELSGIWTVNKFNFDFKEETTEMELQLKVTETKDNPVKIDEIVSENNNSDVA